MDIEHAEQRAQAGTMTTVQFRKILSDTSERINGESLVAVSTEDYLADWLKGIVARNSAGTIERYKNTVRLLLESLGDKAKKPVTALTPHDIETFLNQRTKAGMAPQTISIDLKNPHTSFSSRGALQHYP